LVYFTLDSRLANFYRESFSLLDLVGECVAELRGKAEAKQVRVEVDEDSLRRAVVGDRQYYREAISSLLDNAIKFNKKGGLARVTGRPAPDREDEQYEVIVQDEGGGVPEDLREAIFEEFTQTDNILTAKPDGLGLGLAIARAVCEGHGCRLRLIETSAEGSAFALGVPLQG
jgi:signal transduction histidine kinase